MFQITPKMKDIYIHSKLMFCVSPGKPPKMKDMHPELMFCVSPGE